MSPKPIRNYSLVFNDLKKKIRQARMLVNTTVNLHLLQLYWEIGNTILEEERKAGWGAKIIDKLANDLKNEFTDMKGFSVRNLRYMRDFADAYPDFLILQAQLAKSLNAGNDAASIWQAALAKFQMAENNELIILQAPLAKSPDTEKNDPSILQVHLAKSSDTEKDDSSILQAHLAKSPDTEKNDPSILQAHLAKSSDTEKDDSSILQAHLAKSPDTEKDDSSILQAHLAKSPDTEKNDPSILQAHLAKSSDTEKDDSSILQAHLAKSPDTEKDDPSILQDQLSKFQAAESKEFIILQAQLAKLSWYHHITLLDKVKDKKTRMFYIRKTIEHGWTRDHLVHQIESGLHKRQGALTHNFERTLDHYDSELARQLFKDPYKFEFLGLGAEAKEKDLEQALIYQIERVLLELGEGFALYSRQYKVTAGVTDFFIDLLFYHTKLRRFVVIELKIGDFLPEHVGKMNVYLGLVDDKLKGKYDEPTIGLILCKTRDKIVAEYALRDTTKPIGIAEYQITEMLPEDIKGVLPSTEEIEQKLDEKLESQEFEDVRLSVVKSKLKK